MTNDIYTIQIIDYAHPTNHHLYSTWCNIKQRCSNPASRDFKHYGGTGITMYPEWINDARAFLMWIDSNLRNQTGRIFTG